MKYLVLILLPIFTFGCSDATFDSTNVSGKNPNPTPPTQKPTDIATGNAEINPETLDKEPELQF